MARQDHHHFLSYFNNLADNENASLTEHLIDGCALEKHNPVVASTIRRIRTTDREIIIEANNCHEIKWITNGEVVHTGHVLSLGHTGLKSYVRAELTGEGTTYTQPFGLKSL